MPLRDIQPVTHNYEHPRFNSTPFNDGFGLVSDLQLRSRDDAEGLGTLLIRPGLAWYASPGITPSIGYAYIGSFRSGGPDSDENRIWQQVVTKHSFGSSVVNQRFRLEQRFIDRPDGVNVYSDRFRWFVRGKVPLAAAGGSTYLELQNEVFLGISGEDQLNGESFDQNRAYIGMGRRLNATYQVEIGYMNQFVNGRGESPRV